MLCVISGPSGSGKTSVCRTLFERGEWIYATSCTTRQPREGEVDGRDYHFLSEDEFMNRTLCGEFLEFAKVHGRYYGTLRSEVVGHLKAGRDVAVDIDVQGAALIRMCADPVVRGSIVDIIILPDGMDELRNRLAGRATETEEQLRVRLENAGAEMRQWTAYSYVIVSGSREEDVESVRTILTAERCRSSRLRPAEGADEEVAGARMRESLPEIEQTEIFTPPPGREPST